MRKRGRAIAAAIVAGAMVLGGGGIAFADDLELVDQLLAGSNLQFGEVACGADVSATIDLKIKRQGNAVSKPEDVYKDSTAVSVTRTSAVGVTATAPSPSTITTLENWAGASTGTLIGSATSTVSVDTSTPGQRSGTVTYQASGADRDGGTLVDTVTITARWTVLSCDEEPPADTTAPVVVLTCPPGEVLRNTAQTATWTATDETGFAPGTVTSGTISLDTSTYGAKVASIPAGFITDAAGNPSAVATCPYFVTETDPPVVAIQGCPTQPLLLGQVAEINWTATDEVGGSGLNPEFPSSGTVTLDTASVGPKTATIAAGTVEDIAGNTSAAQGCSYSVIFDFDGFFRPVDMEVVNSVKAGSAVPMKFSLAGDQGPDVIATGFPKINRYQCGVIPEVEPIDETVNAGGSSLSYDPVADQYVYVWKTDKAWAGSCGTFTMKLSDGTVHMAHFQFKK